MPDVWSIYLEVADAEKTTQQVTELGPPGLRAADARRRSRHHGRRGRPQRGDHRHVAARNPHRLRPLDGRRHARVVRAPHPRLRGGAAVLHRRVRVDDQRPRPTSPSSGTRPRSRARRSTPGSWTPPAFLPEGVPSNWSVYFHVDDADAAHRQGGRARRRGRDAGRGHAVRSPRHGHRPHGRPVPPPPVGRRPPLRGDLRGFGGDLPPERRGGLLRQRCTDSVEISASGGLSQGVGNLASWRST